jgi:hypothetical protein
LTDIGRNAELEIMLWGILFWLLFLSVTTYVLLKGDAFKRTAIGIMFFGVAATTIILRQEVTNGCP